VGKTKHYLGACAWSKSLDVHRGCQQLGVYALGWGNAGSVKGRADDEIKEAVLSVKEWGYKRPYPTVRMLATMRDMQPGDHVCLRHRNRKSGSVIVAFGTVTSRYYFSSKHNGDLFDGHDCSHRVDVRWHENWFESPQRPALPGSLWKALFPIAQGWPLVEITAEQWAKCCRAAKFKANPDLGDWVSYPDENRRSEGLMEGGIRRIYVDAVERNQEARRICLSLHGTTCAVCEMSFQEVYGDTADGFIHVHHLKPLAGTKGRRRIDPEKHLRPVCPNCHAVIHMKSPPFTINELKKMIQRD
jgi:hypothetical protein